VTPAPACPAAGPLRRLLLRRRRRRSSCELSRRGSGPVASVASATRRSGSAGLHQATSSERPRTLSAPEGTPHINSGRPHHSKGCRRVNSTNAIIGGIHSRAHHPRSSCASPQRPPRSASSGRPHRRSSGQRRASLTRRGVTRAAELPRRSSNTRAFLEGRATGRGTVASTR
jgi:hypothetical protein